MDRGARAPGIPGPTPPAHRLWGFGLREDAGATAPPPKSIDLRGQRLISVHLLTFYQQAGAALGAVAFFTSTARCFDVLSDPLMAQEG